MAFPRYVPAACTEVGECEAACQSPQLQHLASSFMWGPGHKTGRLLKESFEGPSWHVVPQ